MSTKRNRGDWLSPSEAAPQLGMSAEEVRILCRDREIDHQRRESPGGRVRYLISQAAITGYLRRNTIHAVA